MLSAAKQEQIIIKIALSDIDVVEFESLDIVKTCLWSGGIFLGQAVMEIVAMIIYAIKSTLEFIIAMFNIANLPSGVYFYQLRVADPESSSGQGFVENEKDGIKLSNYKTYDFFKE